MREHSQIFKTFAVASAACFAAGALAQPRAEFLGTKAWLSDFAQLQREMSAHYANLQWATEHRHLNLPALTAQTRNRLRRATTDAEAKAAFEAFLDRFKDGHLEISWPKATLAPAAEAPVGACADYASGRSSPGLDTASLPSFYALTTPASPYFAAGVFRLKNRRIGILRIDLFDEHRFPELCREAAELLKLKLNSPCGDGCQGPLERETANLLTAKLEEQLESLNAARIKALVVDITDNGGGTNWVGPAARTLSPKHLLEARQGYIRHTHWSEQFESRIADIDADLKIVRPADRPLLLLARARYRRALESTRTPCDQSPLWSGRKLGCTFVSTAGPIYTGGVLRYAAPGSLPAGVSCCYLFAPQRYRYREGVYRGRLFVAVDGGTASAAEYFAALLADNRAATVIGERTYGAGCGYTNGGIPTRLKNSGAIVKMPDCVRYRRDGSNEVEGVRPSVTVAWRPKMTGTERAAAFVDALERAR